VKATFAILAVVAAVSVHLGLTTAEDDLLRRANAAFERGEFAAAVSLYEKLEERTGDPGQVAFNKATALYRLGRHREAEQHYRRALEGAEGGRRAAALFGLGNSLVQQEASLGATALAEAVRRYEECLAVGADEPPADDVRHNLELARLLWLQAKADKKDPDRGNQDEGMNETPEQGSSQPRDGSTGGDPTAGRNPKGVGEPTRVKPEAGPTPVKTDEVAPGKGALPPVPDEEELRRLTPEDAAEHLRRATLKVLRERRDHERGAAKPAAAGVKDW
jgi:tetratricopeptide (TPR) repeat protein